MIYRYNKGFKVDELKTNVSKSFLYYVQGSATNEETGDIHVFFSGKIRKHEGINYIYIKDDKTIYNSTTITEDCPILTISLDGDLKLLVSSTAGEGNYVTTYNRNFTDMINQMDEVSAEVDEVSAEVDYMTNATLASFNVEMDKRLEDALALDPYQDTVLEVLTEMNIVQGNTFTCLNIIENILGVYVINSGELETLSINSINGRDIIFSDISLDGYHIEVSYNTLKNI